MISYKSMGLSQETVRVQNQFCFSELKQPGEAAGARPFGREIDFCRFCFFSATMQLFARLILNEERSQ